MKGDSNKPRTWGVFYFFGGAVSLKSNARFGTLSVDGDKLQMIGQDEITIQKSEVLLMDKVTVPVGVSAVRIKTNNLTIIVSSEWFHITRYVIFAGFQGDFQKALFELSNQ